MSENKETARNVMPGRCKPAEIARNYWVVTVEQGTTQDDLKRPEFWALVGKNFRPTDKIEVHCDDGTFFAEYLVITADRAWAKVHELRFERLGIQDVALTQSHAADIRSRFSVKYNGPHLRFCVERKDGEKVERLKEKCADQAEASAWLEGHLKTVGAAA